jgi:tetratricopeptide (TPR) repeat protein
MLALWQGDVERGSSVADELLSLAAATDSGWAGAIGFAGIVASWRDDEDRAAQLYEESARLAREQGDFRLLSIAVNNLGNNALNRGEYERALELFEESLSIGRERNDQDLLARAFLNLGFTTLLLGDLDRARSLLRDGLFAAREIGQVEGFIYGFVGLAAVYAPDDPARAAHLLGRSDALREETASRVLEPLEGGVRNETEAEVRARLGEDAYAAEYEEGRALALADALALALHPDSA